MPRDDVTTTKENVVKKTPRKRAAPKKAAAVKKTAARKTTTRKTPAKKAAAVKKTAARKTTTRKTPAKKIVKPVEVVADEVQEEITTEMKKTRKAPTKFAQENANKKSKRNQHIVIAILLVVGVASSAVLGFTDSEAGQINVSQTIKERNERMANLVDVDGPVMVVPTPSNLPDGGLTGLRPAEPIVKSESVLGSSVSTSTASTTDNGSETSTSAATTTDKALEREGGGAQDTQNDYATDTATTTVDAVGPDVESNPSGNSE